MKAKQIRPPAFSGTFYPSDPTILALQVDRMLDQQEDITVDGKIRALVSPHAGYAYSGPTAAAGYAVLKAAVAAAKSCSRCPRLRKYPSHSNDQ